MNRGYRRGSKRPQKLEGRGKLENVSTDGPHQEWLGMPEYYVHTLVVDGETYTYQSEDKELGFELGANVVFRYKQTTKGNWIDKRSLGIAIDPSAYMAERVMNS